MAQVTIDDVRRAASRIGPYVHRTPVFTSQTIDEMSGAKVFFKCENLQKAGAFKIRGATNAVFSLTDAQAAHGVATHSSGNHAAALALAARWRGVKATVVMPETAPAIKTRAVIDYGAEIVPCAPTLQAREDTLAEVVKRTGAVVIHPYNDLSVIAGQGTAGLELCDQVADLNAVIAPVGGGGLLSGTAVAVAGVTPEAKVCGAEPANVDDAYESLKTGQIVPAKNARSVADGLLTSLGDLTFPIIRELVAEIITVDEDEIVASLRLIWERMKLVVEPSAAVALAALLRTREKFQGHRVGVILSGGNIGVGPLQLYDF